MGRRVKAIPNIVEYTSKSEITPSDKGINAAADAAQVYSRVGRSIGRSIERVTDMVDRHMAVMETSEAYKTSTEFQLNQQHKFDELSKLPENQGNPHFAEQFQAEYNQALDEWASHARTERGRQLVIELSAGMRRDMFRHTIAGQAAMDWSHVNQNFVQDMNMQGVALTDDPSPRNYNAVIGKVEARIDAAVNAINDPVDREAQRTQYRDQYLPALTMSRYRSAADAISKQIMNSEHGMPEESPANEQFTKDVNANLGFEFLKPETQVAVKQMQTEAVARGQEMFRAKNATEKSKAVEEGNAEYAQLYSEATKLAIAGRGPTPELIDAVDAFSQRRGATNAGQVASLNSFIISGRDRAQNNTVQPYNQQVRDDIQTGFAFPKGDPRRPTLASLLQAYSHGQITRDDLNRNTEILNKLDHPEEDPTFKPAWNNFTRWQAQMVQGIGRDKAAGTSAARAQFLHDSTAAFMAQGANGWDKALDITTNAQNPHSFGHVISFYKKAAEQGPNAAAWLQKNDKFYASPHSAPALGSKVNPVYPTAKTPIAPAAPPAPAADLKKADEFLWGKQ